MNNKYKLTYKLIALLLFMSVILLTYLLYKKSMQVNTTLCNTNKKIQTIDGVPNYLSHKGRCFDCEKQMLDECGPSCVWKAQQTKSFDSEREAVNYGASGFLAKTIKYY